MKPQTGPCMYGRETATGGCTCEGYKGRRKGVCSCGHERGWHKKLQTVDEVMDKLLPTAHPVSAEKLTWEQVVVALRIAGDSITGLKDMVATLTKRVEALESSRHLPGDVHMQVARQVAGPPKGRGSLGAWLPEPEPEPDEEKTNGDGLPKGECRVLTAIAQAGAVGASRAYVSQMTGYKSRSITDYATRLRSKGYVTGGWPVVATESGKLALGPSFKPLPTGSALLAYWMGKLSPGESRLLEVYTMAYPQAVSHEQVRSATGYAQRSVTDYASRLLSRRLITKVGHARRASNVLFDRPQHMPEAS